jgi:CRISPR-associated protein Cas6
MQIEVAFLVKGELIPTDHAYPLYSALSHCVREFHDEDAGFRFAPISGKHATKGTIHVGEGARLRVRLPADQIARILPLAGRTLDLGSHRITLRTPNVLPLVPASIVVARFVTFKNSTEPEKFLSVARWKLDELKVEGEPGIPLIEQGERAGEPHRHVLRIKGIRMVGYAPQVAGLTADESLRLQEQGLGGRRRMGCGFFVPLQPRWS